MRSASSFESPRNARSRVRRSATGASTSTTASNCAGSSTSNNSGISFTTMASPRSVATRWSSSRRCCTAGCTMALSAARAASSPMTLARNAARSSSPRATTSVPKRFAIAASTALPGACASRARTSASMTVAPHFLKRSTTVDLPEAMLPVRPTLSTEQWARSRGPAPCSVLLRVAQSDLHPVSELDGSAGSVPHTTRVPRP